MEFRPESTKAVRQLAAERELPLEQAWHRLEEKLRIPDEFNDNGLKLIDARLTHRRGGQDGQPGALEVFHDLRGFLGGKEGRRLDNPARMLVKVRVPNPAGWVLHDLQLEGREVSLFSAEQLKRVIRCFRQRLGKRSMLFADAEIVHALSSGHSHIRPYRVCPPILRRANDVETVADAIRLMLPNRVKSCCTDIDLDLAMAAPDKPLIASMLPKIHLWRVPGENPSEAFTMVDSALGVRAELLDPCERLVAGE